MLRPVYCLSLTLKGVVIGVANIIPGVSGGTMAVVVGIYDRLIEAIGGVLTDRNKRLAHIVFLTCVAIGAAIGLKGLAPIITHALEHHEQLTMIFFMGLITGSLPAVVKLSGVSKLSVMDMASLALGVCLVLTLGASPEDKGSIEAISADTGNLTLFISGILAGGAMIVPGVSGSLVLVLLGAYPVVLHAVDQLDLKILTVVAAGCGLGVLLFSIVIRYMLRHLATPTHAFIFGLVGSSVIILFQGLPTGTHGWWMGSIAFIVGTVIAHASGMVSKPQAE